MPSKYIKKLPFILNLEKKNNVNKILRRLHKVFASPTYPGKHMQIMVRCGRVF